MKITDVIAAGLLVYGLYLCAVGKPLGSAATFVAAAYSWLVSRKGSETRPSAFMAGLIDRYALNVVIIMLIVAALFDFSRHFARVDFGMFYSSALLLRREPHRLYDFARQAEVLKEVSGIQQHHYLTFVYPPFVALLFVPFTFVDFRLAYYLMLVCNVLLLWLAARCLISGLMLQTSQKRALLLCFGAALPVYITFVLGHLSFVGLSLLSMFGIDLIDDRRVRAGLWAGLLSYKVSLLPVPLLVLAWCRSWKGLVLAVGVLAAFASVSVALVGIEGLTSNINGLRALSDESLLLRMHSLRSLSSFLGLGQWGWGVASGAILALLWMAMSRARRSGWTQSCMILCVMLVAPYLHTYDLAIGLAAMAFVISECNLISSAKEKVFVIVTFLPVAVGLWLQGQGYSWPIVPPVLLGLYLYCIYRSLEKRRADDESLAGSVALPDVG